MQELNNNSEQRDFIGIVRKTADIAKIACQTSILDTHQIANTFDAYIIDACTFAVRGAIIEISTHILSNRIVRDTKVLSVSVPRTWWEHFKLDNFPQCLLRRYPVKYRISTDTVNTLLVELKCPHIIVDPEHKHVEWLTYTP